MKAGNNTKDFMTPAGLFASGILSEIGVREQDSYTYAARLLKLLLSWRRLSPAIRQGPSAAGAFFVEAVDGSGKAVELLGIGPSEESVVLDACGYLLKSSGISCPEALKAKLDLRLSEGAR